MDIMDFRVVVGVIDGIHTHFIAPSENEDSFVNRKRFHSLNTQIAFSADNEILDIVSK